MLLENAKLKKKTLTTLILIMKNLNKIQIKDMTFDKGKEKWLFNEKILEEEEIASFCKKIL